MNFKVDYVDTLPPPDLKRKTLPSFQELARPWKERHKWPPDAYGTVITVRREKENHRPGLFRISTNKLKMF